MPDNLAGIQGEHGTGVEDASTTVFGTIAQSPPRKEGDVDYESLESSLPRLLSAYSEALRWAYALPLVSYQMAKTEERQHALGKWLATIRIMLMEWHGDFLRERAAKKQRSAESIQQASSSSDRFEAWTLAAARLLVVGYLYLVYKLFELVFLLPERLITMLFGRIAVGPLIRAFTLTHIKSQGARLAGILRQRRLELVTNPKSAEARQLDEHLRTLELLAHLGGGWRAVSQLAGLLPFGALVPLAFNYITPSEKDLADPVRLTLQIGGLALLTVLVAETIFILLGFQWKRSAFLAGRRNLNSGGTTSADRWVNMPHQVLYSLENEVYANLNVVKCKEAPLDLVLDSPQVVALFLLTLFIIDNIVLKQRGVEPGSIFGIAVVGVLPFVVLLFVNYRRWRARVKANEV